MRSIYLILELSHIQCLFYGKYFGFQVLLLESAIFRGSDESLIEVPSFFRPEWLYAICASFSMALAGSF